MKVVFLDFDGVINIFGKGFSKSAFKNLNYLLDREEDLKIVVSSSWRRKGIKFVKEALKDGGVDDKKVIGITDPKKDHTDRGHHIERWLEDHKEVDKFVIIDDDQEMDHLKSKLVKTNMFVGLTASDVEKAIKILS